MEAVLYLWTVMHGRSQRHATTRILDQNLEIADPDVMPRETAAHFAAD